MSGRPAVFLDRDGVLNRDAWPTVMDPSELQMLPGAAEAVAELTRGGWPVFVVTNKTAMGYGLLSRAMHEEVMALVLQAVDAAGGKVVQVYHCPHTGHLCDCRKPKPGMLLRAAREHSVDLPRSWMVGDTWRDVRAGQAAGCSTILVGAGTTRGSASRLRTTRPDHWVADLPAAVRVILAHSEP